MEKDLKIEKLLSLSEEELKKIFDSMSLEEVDELLTKMNEVINNG